MALRQGGALIPLPEATTTAIGTVDANADFAVVPNPANDRVTISYTSGQVAVAAIYDMAGKLLIHSEKSLPASFNIASLAPGMYLIRFTNAEGVNFSKSFIKK